MNYNIYRFKFPIFTVVKVRGVSGIKNLSSGHALTDGACSVAFHIYSLGQRRSAVITVDRDGKIEDVRDIDDLYEVAQNGVTNFRIRWSGELTPGFRVRKPRWD